VLPRSMHSRAHAGNERARVAPPSVTRPVRPAGGVASEVLRLQRSVGNGAIARLVGDDPGPLDVLSATEGDDGTEGQFLDAADAGVPDAGVPDAGPADAGVPAIPTNLQQILTDWTPGATKYGFQLKFRCSSSSGAVADLQAQAPKLTWREYVTYSRNDFAHRIDPPSPTILPPGPGVSFAPSRTTVVSPNVIEFKGVTDTHWMPTSAVRDTDFVPKGARPLPAIMESSQLYQYSPDRGSTWTTFAGPFTLRRELAPEVGPPAAAGATMPLLFTTNKYGIHFVTERYKP
jgi:hypothetical protein